MANITTPSRLPLNQGITTQQLVSIQDMQKSYDGGTDGLESKTDPNEAYEDKMGLS